MSSVTSHADQKVMDNKECSKNVRDVYCYLHKSIDLIREYIGEKVKWRTEMTCVILENRLFIADRFLEIQNDSNS